MGILSKFRNHKTRNISPTDKIIINNSINSHEQLFLLESKEIKVSMICLKNY